MKELEFFKNEKFGEIEIYTDEDNKVWFPATEIAKILGYSNARDAIQKHCRNSGKLPMSRFTTEGNKYTKTYIDEGNLYRLIIKSRMPGAEEFESWIFDEVLPTLRKTGEYKIKEQPKQLPDFIPITRGDLELKIKYYNAQSKMANCINGLVYNHNLDEEIRDQLIEKSAKLLLDDSIILSGFNSADDVTLHNYMSDYLDEHDVHNMPFPVFYEDFITTYDLKVSKYKVGSTLKKFGYISSPGRINKKCYRVIKRVA